jgi:hypothetical protein
MRGDSFMMVYLAGAIDMVSKEEGANWRLDAIERLGSMGISTFNPMSAFGYVDLDNREAARALVQINEAALRSCHAALFVMSPDKPSIGTPIELAICHNERIPHVVLWVTKDWTLPLPAYLTCYGSKIVQNMQDAMTKIHELAL